MIINRSDLGVGINVTWIEEFIKQYILVAILLVYQHVQKQKQNKTKQTQIILSKNYVMYRYQYNITLFTSFYLLSLIPFIPRARK